MRIHRACSVRPAPSVSAPWPWCAAFRIVSKFTAWSREKSAAARRSDQRVFAPVAWPLKMRRTCRACANCSASTRVEILCGERGAAAVATASEVDVVAGRHCRRRRPDADTDGGAGRERDRAGQQRGAGDGRARSLSPRPSQRACVSCRWTASIAQSFSVCRATGATMSTSSS